MCRYFKPVVKSSATSEAPASNVNVTAPPTSTVPKLSPLCAGTAPPHAVSNLWRYAIPAGAKRLPTACVRLYGKVEPKKQAQINEWFTVNIDCHFFDSLLLTTKSEKEEKSYKRRKNVEMLIKYNVKNKKWKIEFYEGKKKIKCSDLITLGYIYAGYIVTRNFEYKAEKWI